MSNKFQSFPGMEDVLPGQIEKWQWLEEKTRVFFETLGYQEIRTPVLEPTELFRRSIGEATDIVHKEMYSFEDRGGRSVTLRPEMTAAVARAVIQHALHRNHKLLRLYYLAPMFRAERPQAGRKRQFHQIGAEIINDPASSGGDFQIIKDLYAFMTYAGVDAPVISLNDLSLINGEASEKVRVKMRDYFTAHKDQLDKDSLYRLDKNVLRIFDSKAPECQSVIEKAPWEDIAPLGAEFKTLENRLKEEGVPYRVDRRLVRGLDYYTGVVFEVTAAGLGAQDAVAGGGRYDRLYEQLGSAATSCTGFSIGMERLLTVLETQLGQKTLEKQVCSRRVYFAVIEDEISPQGVMSRALHQRSLEVALRLRQTGFQAVLGPEKLSLSEHLKRADKQGFPYVVIGGAAEEAGGTWTLKFMGTKEQIQVKQENLLTQLLEDSEKGEAL